MDTSERWKPKRNATFRLACDDSCKKNNESERWIGKKKINYLFLFKILPTFRMCDFLKTVVACESERCISLGFPTFRCLHLYNCRKSHVGALYFAIVFQRSGVLHRVALATPTLFRSPAEAPRGTPFKLLPGASFVPNLIRKRYVWGDKPVGAPNQSVSREVARLYAPMRGEHSAAEASPNSGGK